MLEAIEMYLYYFRKKKPDVSYLAIARAAHTATASGKGEKKRLINKVKTCGTMGALSRIKMAKLARLSLQTIIKTLMRDKTYRT